MSLKDWKKVNIDEWYNKKTKETVFINKNRFESHYHVVVEKNNNYSSFDNALVTKKEAIQSIKLYMRKH